MISSPRNGRANRAADHDKSKAAVEVEVRDVQARIIKARAVRTRAGVEVRNIQFGIIKISVGRARTGAEVDDIHDQTIKARTRRAGARVDLGCKAHVSNTTKLCQDFDHLEVLLIF